MTGGKRKMGRKIVSREFHPLPAKNNRKKIFIQRQVHGVLLRTG
jgi:hypothetical protein